MRFERPDQNSTTKFGTWSVFCGWGSFETGIMILVSFTQLGRDGTKRDSFLIQTLWKYILGPSPSNLRKLRVEQMLRLFLNYNHQHALLSTSPLLGCLDCAWSSIWLKHVNQYHTERQIKEMHENCDGEINNSVCLMSFPALHVVFIWLLLHGVLIILSYCILL